jgi:hypothetical protein
MASSEGPGKTQTRPRDARVGCSGWKDPRWMLLQTGNPETLPLGHELLGHAQGQFSTNDELSHLRAG